MAEPTVADEETLIDGERAEKLFSPTLVPFLFFKLAPWAPYALGVGMSWTVEAVVCMMALLDIWLCQRTFSCALVGLTWSLSPKGDGLIAYTCEPDPFVPSGVDSNVFWISIVVSLIAWVLSALSALGQLHIAQFVASAAMAGLQGVNVALFLLCLKVANKMSEETVRAKGVVIGYDARHGSREYAEITASIFLMKGARLHVFGMIIATPYVAFAVRLLGACSGVMVTASHNPATDNGYKVYWGNGAQIIEPHDRGIAQSIQENLSRWAGFDIALCTDPTERVKAAYNEMVFELLCNHHADNAKDSGLVITYSAMHGVGHLPTLWAFERFGLPPFVPVPCQVEGNGDFPTSGFPNPEEGEPVFRYSFATAEAHGSTTIICQDPDADRVGLAVKKNGEWKVFHGNHTGVLLTWWMMKHYKGDHARGRFFASTVSTRLQGVMAEREGFTFEETLTGFKWLGNAAPKWESEGGQALLAFEEAIGFGLLPACVPDKDAIAAAAVVGEMAHYLARVEKKDLLDKLDEIYAQYGYFLFNNSYFMCREPAVISAVFERMRTAGPGGKHVAQIGEFKVARIRDMTLGFDSSTPDNKTVLPQQGGHMITFYLENGCSATIRTSGTEPKIKWYIEIGASDAAKSAHDLAEVVKAVQDDLLQREKYNFKHSD